MGKAYIICYGKTIIVGYSYDSKLLIYFCDNVTLSLLLALNKT